ncbi:acetolactate decarboxylase [Cronobacter dublinensis]|uniref:acetolactate decarboxylase n=1 Tax=Cronobacter dublinensis TaxID=413497 RepID=UPI0005190B40|nr:acetolactate decarboxylase [Cronobacter dublinensis]EGT5709668.1 acetolactate decarboxylase [Cronobacter dublinensis subsp. dublinensis]ALB67630.1 alpha-acetolactate decarboxylase [Cronobacter dublinensis subsp. dublinensis LMG 23823]EGT4358459.1 acetolactate decarboxylase [Cronobacter dublinensis]EGT4380710.1 acetolactate decarboxylase [Cronobacter dublinensis]EGT5738226.1 acetolactate decarboxylase [Cronobacter dublinensis subsp. dublinensis]
MSHATDCSCEESLLETVRALRDKDTECVIYQTSMMSALLSGVYEGNTTIADLLTKGDFGLGTFNELDGELIAFSHEVHQLRADGSAREARPDQKTPFAVMTWFKPHYRQRFDRPMSRQQIHDVIDRQVPSDNIFCALRIDGHFRHAHTRTVPRQTPPYRAMTDVLDDQPVFRFDGRDGVLVGFRTPQHMQGINVAGYHEHFITDDRQGGGHLLDYQLENGVLTFGEIHKLMIDLPSDPAFLNANLHPDNLDAAIRSVEN